MPDKGYHFIVRRQMVATGSGITFRKWDYAFHRDSEIDWRNLTAYADHNSQDTGQDEPDPKGFLPRDSSPC